MLFKKKINLIIIPQSAEKMLQWRFSGLIVIGLAILLLVLFAISMFLLPSFIKLKVEQQTYVTELGTMQNQLNTIENEVQDLKLTSLEFQQQLVTLLDGFREIKDVQVEQDDLVTAESLDGGSTDLTDVNNLLSASSLSLDKLRRSIQLQSKIFSAIPSIWPLLNGVGRITFNFGIAKHPLFGYQYLHRGIDISNGIPGTKVLATANGKVLETGYQPFDLGYYIVLEHKYGFVSTYAHLRRINVKKNQEVKVGEIIAEMGNSGLSTGTHLHYELRLGGELLDPRPYLTIR